ncbi:hypothetical protein DV736_g2469, partial [Chaetothyriales sp. CBS 134916]
MARTLPWQGTTEPAPKRRRTTALKPDDGTAEPSHTRLRTSLSIKPRRTGSSRSPSTSPPPTPPPQAEAMQEGYDADDIWMMVEDEFQTLAHSFTRHLHHAEYKRLMIKAKHDAPPKALQDPAQLAAKGFSRSRAEAGRNQDEDDDATGDYGLQQRQAKE